MNHAQRERFLSDLASFDGKSVEPFRRVSAQLERSEASLLEVLTWADTQDGADAEAAIEIGATWVAKDLLEKGAPVPPELGGLVVRLLGRVEAADAKLHLLQILPGLEWDGEEGDEDELLARLESLCAHPKAFVRAWSFNAIGWLAERAPRHRRRVLAILEAAAEAEKASVRVRIRKARERLDAT